MVIEPQSDSKQPGKDAATSALILGILALATFLIPLFVVIQLRQRLSANDTLNTTMVLLLCCGSPGLSLLGLLTGVTAIRMATGKIRDRAMTGLVLTIISIFLILSVAALYFFTFGVLRES